MVSLLVYYSVVGILAVPNECHLKEWNGNWYIAMHALITILS